MEKRGNRGRTVGHPRHPAGFGGAVLGGVLAAMVAGDASATKLPDLPGAEHLTKAISAIEQGNGQDAVSGLESMTAEGDAQAAYLLGTVWRQGLGVSRDFAKAREAYAAAAFLGNPQSMNELGLIYRDGLGVVADPIEAVAWFRVASEYNLASAMENRDTLEAGFTDRQRAAGRALALRRELEIDLLTRDKLGTPPKVPTRPARDASARDIALAMLRQDAEETSSDQNLADDIDAQIEQIAPVSASVPPAPATEKASTEPAALQPYLVQIGVFAKPESIRRIREEAEHLGLSVQEADRDVNGKRATRVTVGPFDSEDAARRAAVKLDAALKVTTKVMQRTS